MVMVVVAVVMVPTAVGVAAALGGNPKKELLRGLWAVTLSCLSKVLPSPKQS